MDECQWLYPLQRVVACATYPKNRLGQCLQTASRVIHWRCDRDSRVDLGDSIIILMCSFFFSFVFCGDGNYLQPNVAKTLYAGGTCEFEVATP